MSENVKVNIIVPMYNVEKYLPDFLDSVLAQTYKDYRIFVVDDCSTDNSKEVLEAYRLRFGGRMVALSNAQNEKSGQTRNHGLEEAEKYPAKYTTFLDSDDTVVPDFLESMVRKAEETDADMIICGMVRIEDKTGKVVCIEAVNGTNVGMEISALKDDMAFINPAVYNKLFRSSCIKGVRFKRMLRSEDTCYLLEVLPRLKKAAYTNRIGYYYRLRNDSLTGAFGKNVCKSMYDGFAEIAKMYEQPAYSYFQEVLETQVFIRCLVGGVCRASFSDRKQMMSNIRDAYAYMNTIFPQWKCNPYLSLGKRRSRNGKELALKVCAYMYRTHTFGVFVGVYYIMLKILKKDVRM